jgi:hypothetical protein
MNSEDELVNIQRARKSLQQDTEHYGQDTCEMMLQAFDRYVERTGKAPFIVWPTGECGQDVGDGGGDV